MAETQKIPIIFLTYEWIATWWHHFGEGRQLFLLTGTFRGQLVTLAPMMISKGRFPFPRAFRIMEFIGTAGVPTRGMGLADRVDFLFYDDRLSLLAHLVNRLFSYRSHYDLLMIRGISGASPSVALLKKTIDRNGLSCYARIRSISPYTKTTGTWEQFLSDRKSKIRRQWQNSCRRLESLGAYEISCYPDNGWPFEKALETMLSINQRSHKWKQGSSLFQSKDVLHFFKDLFHRIQFHRWFITHFLLIEGRPTAYQAGFRYADRLFGYNTAYLREYARAHPGIHLVVHAIEKAHWEGVVEYDMMRGKEPFKDHWCSNKREEISVIAYPSTVTARIYVLFFIRGKTVLKKIRWVTRLYNYVCRIRHGRIYLNG